jgi:hypothetical protein
VTAELEAILARLRAGHVVEARELGEVAWPPPLPGLDAPLATLVDGTLAVHRLPASLGPGLLFSDDQSRRLIPVAAGDAVEVDFGSGLGAAVGLGHVGVWRRRGGELVSLAEWDVDPYREGDRDHRIADEIEPVLDRLAAEIGATFTTTRRR